jgi:hypothetical protein
MKMGGVQLSLGSAEIRVRSGAGELLAAPDLILHYVTAHGYGPPEEFVMAVLTGAHGAVNDGTLDDT